MKMSIRSGAEDVTKMLQSHDKIPALEELLRMDE